jgi:voltage-gated potassium channel
VVERLSRQCGRHLRSLWKMVLSPEEAPALGRWLETSAARLGDLLRSPEDRDQPLHAVALLVQRDSGCVLIPDDDFVLSPGDQAAPSRSAVSTSVARDHTGDGGDGRVRRFRPARAVELDLATPHPYGAVGGR